MSVSLNIATFDELQAEQLHDYMEPLMARDDFVVGSNDLAYLRSRLRGFNDEYHLVYTLLLLIRFDVETIVEMLPDFLQAEEDSVHCVAFNAIQNLPQKYVTHSLLQKVKSAAANPNRGPQAHTLYARLSESVREVKKAVQKDHGV